MMYRVGLPLFLCVLTTLVCSSTFINSAFLIDLCADETPASTAKLVDAIATAKADKNTDLNTLVNTQTDIGESLLHLACIWGDPIKVKALLEAGADPNFRANKQRSSLEMTPLTWCAYAGYTDAVEMFVKDKGTNVNVIVRKEDGGSHTALDIALLIGERGAAEAKLLVDAGAKTYEQILQEVKGHDEI
ncbi:hypothetical protein SARC_13846 [Sphaeroforma arctica JP610]|uniref:Uncharacterized protein n=1 Tax=Sphaeroforma arctica JP610 TaxID=667725 RepID=A0A0L0FA45_9EUKA|nr:hypothetical protein SARC_13846 [Sphaeroforma arctica JP610]KNC73595.1 hypothetical protein SARC_13846 [Sphaeroforma arctica JP610]|eukprot:XP_014147497.1 hypothetical protein SARC_13846 [Sphaeroforma arctica JP610]